MLYVYGFERVAIVVGDLFFVDPDPLPGQDGAENGVRLELRVLMRRPSDKSIYAATPIDIGEPVWRVDLLESIGGRPFDRTHHHPVFTDWDPGDRMFVRELSADPMTWLEKRLGDLDGVLRDGGVPPETAAPNDAAQLRLATPEIVATTRRLLDRVRAGELGQPPVPEQPFVVDGKQVLVRSGWL